MPRAFLGNNLMTMVKRPDKLAKNKVVFKVNPKMTKHEIKEYLTKVYQVKVKKVNTMIYEGKLKRAGAGRMFGRHVYKERDWKKAIVTLYEDIEMGSKESNDSKE
jgi:large subunit ribosomal protein L23